MAAQEAVERLGLLVPEAVNTVFRLLEDTEVVHPKAICTAFRKEGLQLTDEHKRTLKIRKNAFMTREALAEVSELGMQDPIRAHELTVLRASFAVFRHRNALSAERMMRVHPDMPIEVEYDMFHPDTCELCASLHRKPVGLDWGLLPPSGCTCVTAPYGLHLRVDYIGHAVSLERDVKRAPKPSVVEEIKRLWRQIMR
ncbi:MAG: hypothetical protein H6917_04925 [Novosphingobium sp.]|nr:hypothetical protein [Novosphingobium sp.]MCP5401715.1 hypothetical protein [Novosphingobium sp.]